MSFCFGLCLVFWGEKREACVGMSTPAVLVGSRLRVEVLRSGSGRGELQLHLHLDVDGWDVDPTRTSLSVGGPERVTCGERVAEAEAARGAAVRMRGGCG